MANFFDQFDEPGIAPDISAPGGMDAAFQQFAQVPQGGQGGNFFDQFDEAPPEREGAGLVTNFGTGFNDALYGTIGAVVDLPIAAANLGSRAINAVAGTDIPQIEASSRRSLGRTGEYLFGIPNPERIEANTTGEKIARGIGEGVAYTVAPELALRGGIESVGAKVNPYLEATFGRSNTGRDLAANAVVGGASGGGGVAAAEAVPDPWKPYAAMAGGLLGGGAGAAAVMAPRGIAQAGNLMADYAAPFTAGGRERMAATTLRDAATDPVAFRDALENPEQIVPSVPGSRPTTFQQTGDMGIGALERRAETLDAVPFQQRRANQNTARVDYLGSIQRDGSPEAVVNALRENLALLDQQTENALQRATRTAQEKTSRLGGTRAPEDYGSSIRQVLSEAENGVRAREHALWEAVDPDGTLALPADGIRQEVVSVLRTLPKAAKPMEAEERAIFSTAAGFNGVVPFREVSALRTRVSTDMRRELSRYGNTPVYARLSQLRGAIERTIEDAVAGKAAQEATAVASGAMRQEDTMAYKLLSETDAWLAERAARENSGAATASASAGGAAFVSRPSRAEVPGAGRFGSASGDQGLQGSASLQPNFDEAALGRLREATEATKARANTYGTKPVGDVLRRSGQDGPYSVSAASVPARFFRPGPRGYEDIQALRRAADDPQTMKTIRDYAVSTLRRFAERPDGTFDPSKVTIWRERHRDALRAFPEIDRMLKDPVEAAETMARVAVARKAELDEYRAGAIGRLIDAAPEDVTRKLGAVFSTENPTRTMRQLVSETSKNPEAREGLRKGIADWLVQRFISNTEAGTSGQALIKSDQFQTFMRQNEAVLGVVFKPGEIRALKAIAADLQQANRSVSAVKLPGRSNTAQDIIAEAQRSNAPRSWLTWILTRGAQAGAGTAAAGPLGGIAAPIVGEALGNLRRSGLQKVDDILTDALLNPGRALVLLQKVPAKPTQNDIASFATRYRRAAFPSVVTQLDDDEPRRQ